jgi:hypothetical protein
LKQQNKGLLQTGNRGNAEKPVNMNQYQTTPKNDFEPYFY